MVAKVEDSLGRNINYMRISITDRCNLRCKYCMPDGIKLLSMDEILTFEEIVEIVKASAKLGINKIKITGGEPLVRKGCTELIEMIKNVDGVEEVTLTTNGILLYENLPKLLSAGIDGINISLDSFDENRFIEITGVDGFHKVLDSIYESLRLGIKTKINVLLLKSSGNVLTDDFIKIIELSHRNDLDVRFIEVMPIGRGKDYEVVSNAELLDAIKKYYSNIRMDYESHGNGPAKYIKIDDFKGSIGFIRPINNKFCSECNRIRLTSTGVLKPCLCYGNGIDLKPFLNNKESLESAIKKGISIKPDGHCFENKGDVSEKMPMASIGG